MHSTPAAFSGTDSRKPQSRVASLRQPQNNHGAADHVLEIRIAAAHREFAEHGTREKWRTLAALISQRSAEQVARMEAAKGLR